MHCVSVTVLLDRSKFTMRLLGAALLVGESIVGLELILKGGRHPDLVTTLANPGFEQVTSIVVLSHPDRVPGDCDLVSIAHSHNVGWWFVKLVGNDQVFILLDDCIDIACDINNIRGQPAGFGISVHFYIEPRSSVRGATPNDTGVTGLQFESKQVNLCGAITAGSQGLVNGDFGEIKGGRGSDGGGGCDGRSGRRGWSGC